MFRPFGALAMIDRDLRGRRYFMDETLASLSQGGCRWRANDVCLTDTARDRQGHPMRYNEERGFGRTQPAAIAPAMSSRIDFATGAPPMDLVGCFAARGFRLCLHSDHEISREILYSGGVPVSHGLIPA